MKITKAEAIRFISHLDYTRTLERAIRRAKLPAAYSEGFNPHLKFSFASALAVGVTSSAEYMDLELSQAMDIETLVARLRQALPEGIALVEARVMPDAAKALMAVVNRAEYDITLPLCSGVTEQAVVASVAAFVQDPVVVYLKHTPKGTREIDIKEFVAAPPEVHIVDRHIVLQLKLHIKPTGSVKPTDVLDVLVTHYQLPSAVGSVIHRTALLVHSGEQDTSPLQL